MRRRDRVLHAFLSVLTLVGCVRRYEEPPITEPHALVKFRVLHHEPLPNTSLSESVRLDGYDIRLPDGAPTEPRLRAVRVRPHPASYRFTTEYFHTYSTTRTEYVTETYSCGGYGTNARTCTRTVPRTVTDHHHVTDAACETGLSHAPLAGAVYVIQYDFYGAGACSASCYRQLDLPGGDFQLLPCGPAEAPVEPTAGGEARVSLIDAPMEGETSPRSTSFPTHLGTEGEASRAATVLPTHLGSAGTAPSSAAPTAPSGSAPEADAVESEAADGDTAPSPGPVASGSGRALSSPRR
jgi:hypothetical protein